MGNKLFLNSSKGEQSTTMVGQILMCKDCIPCNDIADDGLSTATAGTVIGTHLLQRLCQLGVGDGVSTVRFDPAQVQRVSTTSQTLDL